MSHHPLVHEFDQSLHRAAVALREAAGAPHANEGIWLTKPPSFFSVFWKPGERWGKYQ